MANRKNDWDIAILGAGASGLMAAISAAALGCTVLLLEQKNRAGKKILATGNGKCNFTNERMEDDCFRGSSALLHAVLPQFTRDQTLEFFHRIGIYPKNRNGYYYPNSQTASSVLEALETECIRLGVEQVTSVRITKVEPAGKGFYIRGDGFCYRSRRIIFATGLLASPKLGSDGSAFGIIQSLGHHFTPIVPALCGFRCSGMDFKSVSGVRTDASVRLYIDRKLKAEDTGEIQMADYGISGIPVFQISRFASVALHQKKKPEVRIDFLPEMEKSKLWNELSQRFHGRKERIVPQMNGLLIQKLNPALIRKADIPLDQMADTISSKQLHQLVSAIKEYPVTVLEARGFEFAQVCAGGIRTEEILPQSLESRIVRGVYFAGEILDVDGICGGYNLQWAWSSGYAAGTHAAKSIRQEKKI